MVFVKLVCFSPHVLTQEESGVGGKSADVYHYDTKRDGFVSSLECGIGQVWVVS